MANAVEKSAKQSQEVQAKKSQASPAERRYPSTRDIFDRLWEEDFPSLWSRKLMPFRDLMQFDSKHPIVDVIDRDDEIVVRAEIPGVDKKDLEVTMSNHSITIKGEKSQVQVEENEDFYRKEIVEGKFSRSIELPADAGSEVRSAKFKNGLLELVISKSEGAKRHQIKIE